MENAMSNLSRRSLVASAAALPALAVPAVAIAAHPSDAKLAALSLEVVKAWDVGLTEACAKLAVAETKYYDWLDLNRQATESEKSEFKKHCGLDEARAAEKAANNQFDQSVEAICEVRAQTLRGLIAKARATDLPDGVGDDMAWSIVNDLLAMGAVQS
jgi:hypothetical protein